MGMSDIDEGIRNALKAAYMIIGDDKLQEELQNPRSEETSNFLNRYKLPETARPSLLSIVNRIRLIPLQKTEKGVSETEQLFNRTVRQAEKALRINVNINIAVVLVGVVLLTYSIIYGWINGLDVYSTALGSIGVGVFISTFFYSPQRKIQETVGDFTQIQMFYRTYIMQIETIIDWIRKNKEMTLEELGIINKQLQDLTSDTTQRIENVIGAHQTDQSEATALPSSQRLET